MKKVVLVVSIAWGLLLLAVVAVVAFYLSILPRIEAELCAADETALREQTATALPLGSTVEEVEAWATREGFSHRKVVDTQGHFEGITASKPYSNWATDWYRPDAHVHVGFGFDENGKRSKWSVSIFVPSL